MIRGMAKQERIGRGVYVQALKDHYRVRVRHARYDEGRERYPFKHRDVEQVRAFAKRLSAKLEAGDGERTVGDVLAAFDRQYLPTLRRTTEDQWRRDIRLHLKPFWWEIPLASVRRDVLFAFGEDALSQKKSPWTIRRSYTVLRAAINWWWSDHEIQDRNPAGDVTPVWDALRQRYGLELSKGKAWTRDEAQVLLEEASKEDGPLYPILRLAFSTGMRLGEIQGLQWRDIVWEAGQIRVCRTIDSRGREAAPKNGRERRVDTSPEVLRVLRSLRPKAKSLRWIFATRSGQPIFRKRIYDALARTKTRLREKGTELPEGKSIHSARHTFVSLGIAARQDDEWLRRQVGHHSSAYTRGAYAHEFETRRDLSWVDDALRGTAVVQGGTAEGTGSDAEEPEP